MEGPLSRIDFNGELRLGLSSEFIVMGAGAVRCGRNREKTLTLNYIEVDCARSGAALSTEAAAA